MFSVIESFLYDVQQLIDEYDLPDDEYTIGPRKLKQ